MVIFQKKQINNNNKERAYRLANYSFNQPDFIRLFKK